MVALLRSCRARRALLWLAAAVALTSCRATIVTDVTVDGDPDTPMDMQVSFTLDAQAAQVVRDEPELADQITGVFNDTVAGPALTPALDGSGPLTWSSHVTQSEASELAPMTGVQGVVWHVDSVGGDGQLAVQLVRPQRLLEGFAAAEDEIAGETMGQTTRVQVRVQLPGRVDGVAVDGAPADIVTIDGDVLTVTAPAGLLEGPVTVTATTRAESGPQLGTTTILVVVLGLAAAAIGATVVVRRREKDR